MKMAKLLIKVLTISIVFTTLTGCGKQTEVSKDSLNDVASQKVEVVYPIKGEGIKKLSFWLPIQPAAAKYINNYKDQEVFQEISKQTGVEVEFIHPAVGQEKEQLGVLVASGNLPDIIQIRNLYNGGSPAGVDDGVFRDLTKLIPSYAPDYYKAIRNTDEAFRLATTNDGKITEFTILKQTAPAFDRLNFRDDVIKEIGYTDTPITISDYEEAFEKMKAKGIVGFAPVATGRVNQFMWPFGITEGFFIGTDGKVKWGQAESAFKDYLTLMNKWWNSGYLYKDFMSNITENDRRALWTNKKVGMFPNSVDIANSLAIANKFKSMPANYPRLKKEQPIHFETVSWETLPVIGGESMATVVTTNCKNPEIALQYLNYYYTQEGADLANWGIKDKSYKIDTNGKKNFTDYMYKNEKITLGDAQTMLKIHLVAKLAEPDVVCNPNVISNVEALALRNKHSEDKTIDNKQVLPTFQLSPEKSVERNTIMRDIITYADEMTLKFIIGASPLSDFDKYVAQLKAMKIDEAIKITQEGYDQFKNKPGIK